MEKFINITDKAINFLRESVEKENGLGIRINVAPGGCQGMSYELSFVKEIDPSDLVIQKGGVDIYVVPQAVPFISGINIDYVTNPMGGNLVFGNPNAKSCCGCGQSFCTDDTDSRCGGSCF
ncbi:MAG: iron-sulfur cluster assembly accessory protein [Holosporaceae bacterium]|jgi:iron-sulfur cluster assembly protein|nr:iron-sulfur cluster assembly accessory protein [Holosporaceae bacterium]